MLLFALAAAAADDPPTPSDVAEPLAGTDSPEALHPGRPVFTLTSLHGIPYGLVGAQAEYYFVRGFVSAFVGTGLIVGLVSATGGVRIYSRGRRHRIYVDGGLGGNLEPTVFVPLDLGYQYLGDTGFTFFIGAGPLFLHDTHGWETAGIPAAAFGFGKTHRKMEP